MDGAGNECESGRPAAGVLRVCEMKKLRGGEVEAGWGTEERGQQGGANDRADSSLNSTIDQ